MIGRYQIGAEAIAGSFIHSPPTATLTAPASTITTSNVIVNWTYFSFLSRPQAFFRVKLKTVDGSTTLFDSTALGGVGLTYTPAYTLSDGSSYMVVLSVSDGFDWSDEVTTIFLVQLAGVADYPNVAVGSIYEVGINGQGYMLADSPAGELQYRRQVSTLQAPRFAQGDTPFSEAVERYTMIGFADWRDGAGQQHLNRDDSSPAAFIDSEGINPFEEKGLQLLPATAQTLANSYSNPLSVIASNKLYSLTGTNTIKEVASIGGAVTSFTVAGQTTTLAMASDGVNWYVADGANIHRNSTAVDPGAAWSVLDARVLAWAADRVCIAYPSPGSTPNVFSTLSTAGAEEVGGGRLVLPVGSTITSITGGDGYVWFAARRNQQGLVYAWKAGSTDSPFVAFEFPTGQFPQALGFYLGNVFVRCVEPLSAGGAKAVIYRAATSSGRLVPVLVSEIESSTDDHTVGAWAGDSRFALFSWKKQAVSGASGVGCIDLSSGGNCRWMYAPSAAANGDVVSVLTWNGRAVFAIAGYGVAHEDTVPLTAGNLRTSLADLASATTKVFGQMKADLEPLPTGGGVTITYSVDGGASFLALATLTGAGLQSLQADIDRQAASISLKIALTATTVTPVVRSVTVRAHMIGLADQVLIMPVNCADTLSGLNGYELPESGVGRGAARARFLESLAQTRIRLQDIDWPLTQTATIWEVEQVEIRSVGVFNRQKNIQVQSQVAVLQLRRSFK